MSPRPRPSGRRGALAATAGGLVLAGAVTLGVGLAGHDGPPAPAAVAASSSAPDPSSPDPSSPAPSGPAPTTTAPATPDALPAPAPDPVPASDFGPVLPASDPVVVTIDQIGVVADDLERLTVGADGVLPAPVDYGRAGWWTDGPTPGQLGPAVVAGHVDGPDGPAVFYRLGEVQPGAEVRVTRADGSVATFVVDHVERYAKADFPTSEVYGNTTDRAELRVITCGGAFDRSTGHYVDNVVVYAHLVA